MSGVTISCTESPTHFNNNNSNNNNKLYLTMESLSLQSVFIKAYAWFTRELRDIMLMPMNRHLVLGHKDFDD